MDPLTIALFSGLPGVILGGIQGYHGIKMAKEVGSKRTMPTAIEEMLGIARSRAATRGLPGQEAIEQNIQAGTSRGANLLERSATGAQLLGGITDLAASEQGQMANLGVASAQQSLANEEQLKAALGVYGQYQREIQRENQNMAAGLMDAAIQNVIGGVGAGISGYTGAKQSDQMLSILQNMYKSDEGGEAPLLNFDQAQPSLNLTPSTPTGPPSLMGPASTSPNMKYGNVSDVSHPWEIAPRLFDQGDSFAGSIPSYLSDLFKF